MYDINQPFLDIAINTYILIMLIKSVYALGLNMRPNRNQNGVHWLEEKYFQYLLAKRKIFPNFLMKTWAKRLRDTQIYVKNKEKDGKHPTRVFAT